MAAMGESGLRAFCSSGSDFGEMVNRAVSYQTAQRLYQGAQGRPGAPDADDMRSRSNTWVTQNDSLIPIFDNVARPVFGRVLVRVAGRDEPGRVQSRSDRLDLGILYAPTAQCFVSIGIGAEETTADILYADGRSRGQSFGPRFDAGMSFGPVWSAGIRYDHLKYQGDSEVNVNTPAGRLNIARDNEYTRQYLQADLIGRFYPNQLPFLPERSVLRWTTSLQMLDNRYEQFTDSLGRQTSEPFGHHERLSLLRSGFNVSRSFREGSDWSMFGELAYDYQFDTNMAFPIDDRSVVTGTVGIVRQLARGKRVQVFYDYYHHTRDRRSRSNISLIGVIDF